MNVSLHLYQTPEDVDAGLAAILALINNARERIRVLMYGLNHPQIVAALGAAKGRGVDVRCILDRTQDATRHEAIEVHILCLAIGADAIRIGTSQKHRIMHRKSLVCDSLTSVDGSFNFTTEASLESNSINVIVSADYAAQVEAEFDRLWTFISTDEPQYASLAS